jgi:hypothetical protein
MGYTRALVLRDAGPLFLTAKSKKSNRSAFGMETGIRVDAIQSKIRGCIAKAAGVNLSLSSPPKEEKS